MIVNLDKAIFYMRRGDPVAFPTETVYGLGAPLFNPEAIAKIYALKKRPADNPLIAHVDSIDMAAALAASLPKNFYHLAEHFWPGPLTLVVPVAPHIPTIARAGLPSIALRAPAHSTAQRLIHSMAEPLVAPSANLSGHPSATSAAHVSADFPTLPILDGGECPLGLESTVISLLEETPTLLRPGALCVHEIENFLGHPLAFAKHLEASPGTRHRHYAPSAPITLYTSQADLPPDQPLLSTEPISTPHTLITPANLYATLRSLTKPTAIFCQTKNLALLDRLQRAESACAK